MNLPIVIKKKQALYPLYLTISAVMLCISLLFLFFPFIDFVANALGGTMTTGYMILGCIGTLFFAFTTSSIIFTLVSPPTAIKISKNGLHDSTVAGVGAGFIPKDAIISLKTFGTGKGMFLGIKLDTKYLDTLSSNKKVREEISSNTSSGLPAIIIKQSDILMPISELLKNILEAYGDGSEATVQSEAATLEEIFGVQDINEAVLEEEIAMPESEMHPISIPADEQEQEQKTDDSINYTTFSPLSVDDEYTPILVNPEKPRIKTVEDLLAQLNITKNAKPEVNEQGEGEKNQ